MDRGIINKLNQIAKEKSNQGQLAQYLLNYEGEISELKIRVICDNIYVSVATATRLAKRLGLSGFNELKVFLQEERQQQTLASRHYQDITAEAYKKDVNQALSDTFELVDNELIKKISQVINQKSIIDFYAVGGSNIVLSDFAYKLARLKKRISVDGDVHLQHVQAMNSNEDTIAFSLSYSGNTADIIEMLKLAKKNGAKTILVTGNKNINYDFIDYVVLIEATDMSRRMYSITSRIAALSVLDLIYLKLLDTDHDRYNQILERTRYEK